ncbi:DUF1501 domain-containing protein [Elongatibacter sediminis]|uniref:DUF1501 domain-containing protein n=1 Tax=Elongatibacter sediminis TaxID=3119006 RepID=A0AAW9REY7_9GAMM
MKRRQFLKSGPLSAAALGAFASRAEAAPAYNEEILVHIFLRGGIDGANLVVPLDANDHEYYSVMRPSLGIPDTGPGSALPIGSEPFGFNPVTAPLLDLYNAGNLAIVQAVGTPDDIASRSHFDAEKYIELGTPGLVGTPTGWLHRHFDAMATTLGQYPPEIFLPIIAFRNNPPVSLLGSTSALTVNSPSDFKLDNAFWRWSAGEPEDGYMQLDMLPDIYSIATDEFSEAGAQALAAEALLRLNFDPEYTGSGSLAYGDNTIGQRLSDIAQLIKLDLGARIFTVDYHNFDSHTNQDNPDNYDTLLAQLAAALAAFLNDLQQSGGSYAQRTTVVLQSEFGRRLYQNVSNGTDHGNGNLMLVLGDQVNGGAIYGNWPGLYPGTADGFVTYPNPKNGSTEPELFQGALATTTDFRRVLSEYLDVRCEHTTQTLANVFPGYSGYTPMGIFQPLAPPPETIFGHGFET